MKLTKSTKYIVELTEEEFNLITEALGVYDSQFEVTVSNEGLLSELYRRFYEKE